MAEQQDESLATPVPIGDDDGGSGGSGDGGGIGDPVEIPQVDSIGDAIDVILNKLAGWLHQLTTMLPNLVVAVLILIVTAILAKLVAQGVYRLIGRAASNRTVAGLVAALVKVAVIGGGLFVSLSVLQLDRTVTSLLAGAGIIGLALGFAFQDLAANLLAGVMMAVRRPLVAGDLVKTQGYLGFVEKLNLRNTILQDFEGQRVLIPNKLVFENPLENFSQTGERRIDVDVGLHYDTDLDHAESILRETVEAFDWRHPEHEIDIWFLGFEDSSIHCSVRYWIAYPDGDVGYFDAIHRGVKAVRRACAEAGITIPFPIRTIDVGDGLRLRRSARHDPRPGGGTQTGERRESEAGDDGNGGDGEGQGDG